MLGLLLHDPDRYEAKTLEQAIQKLARLNEMHNARDRWGQNIYSASKDLDEKFHHDFIRYLANPAGFKGTPTGDKVESIEVAKIPKEGLNRIDEEYTQQYKLIPRKNGDFDVFVTNVDTKLTLEEDEKVPQ